MSRIMTVFAVLLVVAAAAGVYRLKYQSVRQTVEIERLNRAIAHEKAAITVLRAEWAHLSRPDRIQNLAAKHLDLKLPDPRQRVALADLPMRPARVDSIAETIASLGAADTPIFESAPPSEDLIGRTIESMGLAVPDPAPFGYPP